VNRKIVAIHQTKDLAPELHIITLSIRKHIIIIKIKKKKEHSTIMIKKNSNDNHGIIANITIYKPSKNKETTISVTMLLGLICLLKNVFLKSTFLTFSSLAT
jgi:hypothetical protein